jgi:hypothetical protein
VEAISMYVVKLNQDQYLISVGRVRLWEPITPLEDSAYLHLYDLGYKPTKDKKLATIFHELQLVDDIINLPVMQMLYPDAQVEEYS